MPEETTFTQSQLDALTRDAVEKATAELVASVASLETEKAGLQSRIDVLEIEKAAAETKAVAAEQAFETFKADEAAKVEASARQDTRVAEIREVAKHLKEEFFTPERAGHWARMSDDEFAAFKTQVTEIAASLPPGNGIPAETAGFVGEAPTSSKKYLATNWIRGDRNTPKEG